MSGSRSTYETRVRIALRFEVKEELDETLIESISVNNMVAEEKPDLGMRNPRRAGTAT
jgi:hypothetical protein